MTTHSAMRPRQCTYEQIIGRYALYPEIASGGMATVHLGKLLGPAGFSRVVAIKKMHPHFAKDPEFVAMFLDEARLATRIRHPNVVSTLDVVAAQGEVLLVMDFVLGESLHGLLRSLRKRKQRMPVSIATSVIAGILFGLHAAHEAKSERGTPLGLVHRDVSPQNIIVGTDGTARILDFGIAKAVGRMHETRDNVIKGKLAYMPPEQVRNQSVDRRVDVFAAAAVLWEALAGQRLFEADDAVALLSKVLTAEIPSLLGLVSDVPPELERIVRRGLERDVEARYQTARDMAVDLENTGLTATARQVGDWLESMVSPNFRVRAESLAAVEGDTARLDADLMHSRAMTHDAFASAPDSAPNEVQEVSRSWPRQPGSPVAVDAPSAQLTVLPLHGPAVPGPAPSPTPALLPNPGLATPPVGSVGTPARDHALAVPMPPNPAGEAVPAGAPVSAIHPVADIAPHTKKLGLYGLAGAGAGVAVLIVVAVLVFLSSPGTPSDTSTRGSAITPTETLPPATASQEDAKEPAPPAVSSAPSPSLAASSAPRRPKPRAPVAKPKVDCSNPFTLDERGVRIPRRECF